MRSKLAKIPQKRWPELDLFDFVVWFDDKFRINITEAYTFLASWPAQAAVAFHRHPRRCVDSFPRCAVLEEVGAAVQQQHRYRRQERKMKAYLQAQEGAGLSLVGHPLYQAGFIIYSQRHPETARFQLAWLQHIHEAGINDQVSLFFVAQIFATHILEFKKEWGQQVYHGREFVVEPGITVAVLS